VTGTERILTVLKLGEPDRVPTLERDIDSVPARMTNGGSYEDFIEQFEQEASWRSST